MEPGGDDPGPQLEGEWAGRDAAAPEMRGGTSTSLLAQDPVSKRSDELSIGHRPAAALRAAISMGPCPPGTGGERAWSPEGVREGRVTEP